jgi:hypothetical protein
VPLFLLILSGFICLILLPQVAKRVVVHFTPPMTGEGLTASSALATFFKWFFVLLWWPSFFWFIVELIAYYA